MLYLYRKAGAVEVLSQCSHESINMSSWLLFLNSKNMFSSVGDLYACTHSAWASITKLIVFLLEECWGSSSHLNEYSGLLKGYVCTEGYRFVWFDQYQYAGPCDVEVAQFLEGRALTTKNLLYWFYLPREYRQFTHHYVDLKCLHMGRVPFEVTPGNEDLTYAIANESTLQANSELFLFTEDSKDVLFYCIQSQHISEKNVLTKHRWNGAENSSIEGFPHHPFRCISFLEACNIPADRVPLQSRAMIEGVGVHDSVESSDDLKLAITSAHTHAFSDDACMLARIKDEPDDDCELNVMHEKQQNPEEQQLQQPQGSPGHDNSPSLRARTRRAPNCKENKMMNYRNLLSISKSYGEIVEARENAGKKTLGAISSRVVPTLLLQCPGCGKYRPLRAKTYFLTNTHLKHTVSRMRV